MMLATLDDGACDGGAAGGSPIPMPSPTTLSSAVLASGSRRALNGVRRSRIGGVDGGGGRGRDAGAVCLCVVLAA